jgi:hypothetical protein
MSMTTYGEGWRRGNATTPTVDAVTLLAAVDSLVAAPMVIAARRIRSLRARHLFLFALIGAAISDVLDSAPVARRTLRIDFIPHALSALVTELALAPNSPNNALTASISLAVGRRFAA